MKSMIWSSLSQSDQISLLSTWVFTHKTLYTPGAMRHVTALTVQSGTLLKEIRLELCCWWSVQIWYRGGTDHWTGLRMKAHDVRGIQDERRSSGLIAEWRMLLGLYVQIMWGQSRVVYLTSGVSRSARAHLYYTTVRMTRVVLIRTCSGHILPQYEKQTLRNYIFYKEGCFRNIKICVRFIFLDCDIIFMTIKRMQDNFYYCAGFPFVENLEITVKGVLYIYTVYTLEKKYLWNYFHSQIASKCHK